MLACVKSGGPSYSMAWSQDTSASLMSRGSSAEAAMHSGGQCKLWHVTALGGAGEDGKSSVSVCARAPMHIKACMLMSSACHESLVQWADRAARKQQPSQAAALEATQHRVTRMPVWPAVWRIWEHCRTDSCLLSAGRHLPDHVCALAPEAGHAIAHGLRSVGALLHQAAVPAVSQGGGLSRVAIGILDSIRYALLGRSTCQSYEKNVTDPQQKLNISDSLCRPLLQIHTDQESQMP